MGWTPEQLDAMELSRLVKAREGRIEMIQEMLHLFFPDRIPLPEHLRQVSANRPSSPPRRNARHASQITPQAFDALVGKGVPKAKRKLRR